MNIIQFEDKFLAHYAYALISDGEMILVDPARNPQSYYDLAERENAKITTIIETHPHADFVSSHKGTAVKTARKFMSVNYWEQNTPTIRSMIGTLLKLEKQP